MILDKLAAQDATCAMVEATIARMELACFAAAQYAAMETARKMTARFLDDFVVETTPVPTPETAFYLNQQPSSSVTSVCENSLDVHASATTELTELDSECDEVSSQETVLMDNMQQHEEGLVVGPAGQLIEREVMEAVLALIMLSRGEVEK